MKFLMYPQHGGTGDVPKHLSVFPRFHCPPCSLCFIPRFVPRSSRKRGELTQTLRGPLISRNALLDFWLDSIWHLAQDYSPRFPSLTTRDGSQLLLLAVWCFLLAKLLVSLDSPILKEMLQGPCWEKARSSPQEWQDPICSYLIQLFSTDKHL